MDTVLESGTKLESGATISVDDLDELMYGDDFDLVEDKIVSVKHAEQYCHLITHHTPTGRFFKVSYYRHYDWGIFPETLEVNEVRRVEVKKYEYIEL